MSLHHIPRELTVSSLASVGCEPGTYALVCRSPHETEIRVGRLGVVPFRRGFYVYVGSAFGPGGVRARVARHVTHPLNRHWHVDYLWPALGIEEIWYSQDPRPREHAWARVLCHGMRCSMPFPQFGSTDCECEAHLAFFGRLPSFPSFRAHLHDAIPSHHAVTRLTAGAREGALKW